ncbi:DUF3152 domain-containing protein [Streptomyces bohaiensis]|uniref:DUF3152 domain-containing protein n=1 Tax=Streptomyces bohaiensis TaxID=1431344 RepID=A0ABX1CF88_9ACTN|nr:DUF3152 domain-containing protein [Streptomyces bohaiensis]NJQ15847.1 DUF3152 domain-containing protein [Streptomyces bohaiensis]
MHRSEREQWHPEGTTAGPAPAGGQHAHAPGAPEHYGYPATTADPAADPLVPPQDREPSRRGHEPAPAAGAHGHAYAAGPATYPAGAGERGGEHPAEDGADAGRMSTGGAHRRDSGPRQEYIDAFDQLPRPAQPARGASPRSRPGPVTEQPPATAPSAESGGDGGGEEPSPPAPSGVGGSWARTVTGLAAAGVVTVLTISVMGQMAEAEQPSSAAGQDASEVEGEDGAGQGDKSPNGTGGAVEDEAEEEPALSYEEAMAQQEPFDPELTGSGELVPVVGAEDGPFPDAPEQLRYRVDVEEGLGLDAELFAEAVHRTLSDPRSWTNHGARSFTRVSGGNHDFVVTLASPGTTAEWCAKSGLNTTIDNVSCDAATTDRIMINAWRWAQGADTYGPDRMHEYRQMVINHEVGHRVGYGHAVCPSEGALAPVMMQQTKFLTINGITCEANAWPHPVSS